MLATWLIAPFGKMCTVPLKSRRMVVLSRMASTEPLILYACRIAYPDLILQNNEKAADYVAYQVLRPEPTARPTMPAPAMIGPMFMPNSLRIIMMETDDDDCGGTVYDLCQRVGPLLASTAEPSFCWTYCSMCATAEPDDPQDHKRSGDNPDDSDYTDPMSDTVMSRILMVIAIAMTEQKHFCRFPAVNELPRGFAAPPANKRLMRPVGI